MKRVLLFLVLIIGINTSSTTVPATNLKVISYNIWNGFDWGKDMERRGNLIKWMKEQAPDVVALQELCGYTQEKLLKDAQEWGHNYAEIVKTSGYPVGITSSKPIQVKERILNEMHHGALYCETWGIDFMVVHFSPFSYEKRRREAKIVLDKLSESVENGSEYIVLGDYNAVSPFDADLYQDKTEMMKILLEDEKKREHVRNLENGQLEYGVLSKFLSYPLVDVVQKFTSGYAERLSCPTQVFEEEKGAGPHLKSKRIDYILSSPILATKCTAARVSNQSDTYYLSDHYPVVAEFSLN